MGERLKEIENYINQYPNKIIAIDCFDTIISRRVSPSYVKKLWAKELINYLDLNCSVCNIYDLRVKLESEIAHKNFNEGHDNDFNYIEFCNLFAEILIQNYKLENSKPYLIDLFLNLELNTECRVTFINEDVMELLYYCKELNKKVILISDFYLPKKYILQLLQFHEIDKYFDELFISCDSLSNKITGKLYLHVLNELKIDANSLIMIGDNIFADYRAAMKLKINAFFINRKDKYDYYKEFEKKYIDNGIIINNIKVEEGLKNIMFNYYAFIDLLYSRLLKDNVRHVYFLSRDGKFLKKLFDLYREKQQYKKDDFIESSYLMISRKSSYIASLDELENEKFAYLNGDDFSISNFLNILNFTNNEIQAIKSELYNINFEDIINNFINSNLFEQLKKADSFSNIYEKKISEYKRNLKNYLKSQFFDEKSCINLIDVGWKGSIQNNIYKLFNYNKQIKGYYLGLYYSKETTEMIMNQKNGILISYNLETKKHDNSISKFYSITNIQHPSTFYEIPLMCNEGSVLGYLDNNSIVIEEDQTENDFYNKIIKPLQTEILIYYNQILDEFKLSTISFKDYKAKFISIHFNLIEYLDKNKYLIQNIYFKDNFYGNVLI